MLEPPHLRLRLVQVLYGLMAANTAVFVMWYTLDPTFMGRHFLCSPASVLVDLRAYTLLTCSFSHIGFSHFVRPHPNTPTPPPPLPGPVSRGHVHARGHRSTAHHCGPSAVHACHVVQQGWRPHYRRTTVLRDGWLSGGC